MANTKLVTCTLKYTSAGYHMISAVATRYYGTTQEYTIHRPVTQEEQ